MKTYAWLNCEGMWLVLSTRRGFIGDEVYAGFTRDLNKAAILSKLPEGLDCADTLTAVPATATRTVTIGI